MYVDGEPVRMQIAAMGDDADPLADGSGKTKIAWVSEYLLMDNHRMNPSNALGGWEKSEMRTYLRETIFPDIPAVIRGAIKEVTKYTKIFNVSGDVVNDVESTDTVWIPSYREVTGGSACETTGVVYTGLFSSADLRKKSKPGSASAVPWWTRSIHSSGVFYSITGEGNAIGNKPSRNLGVTLGFCT